MLEGGFSVSLYGFGAKEKHPNQNGNKIISSEFKKAIRKNTGVFLLMLFDLEREKKPLESYIEIKHNQLYVAPRNWLDLIEFYSEEEIKKVISSTIKTLPFPLREYSEGELQKDWNTLISSEPTLKYEEWEAPRQAIERPLLYKGKPLVLFGDNKGKTISDQFTQPLRMECGYGSGGSPAYEWANPDKDNTFLRGLFGFKKEEILERGGVHEKTLRRLLISHTYMASQFKTIVAKGLYNYFQAKNVLDFSAGWGDRLVGFHASNAQSYVGIDPNTKLHEKYKAISEFCNTGKKTEFISSPAEDADLGDREFDFIFTSPPYFDIERYSEEETQSWKRYPDVNLWVKGFLFPTLNKCWNHLSEGGRILVNIADKKGFDLCSPMLKYMRSLGAIYEGVIGYEMYQRAGQKTKLIFCEPIWVWSKGEASEPKWKQDTFFGV